VLYVVAKHLQLSSDEVQLAQHVVADLHLDPLDLVLIVLRLEDLEQVEFPIAELDRIQCVGDFAVVMRELRRAPSPWRAPAPSGVSLRTPRTPRDARASAGRRARRQA
jgi:acyl carrier protein